MFDPPMADADCPLVEPMLVGGVVPHSARYRVKAMTFITLLVGLVSALLCSHVQGWQRFALLEPGIIMNMRPMKTLRSVQVARARHAMHPGVSFQLLQPVQGRYLRRPVRAESEEKEEVTTTKSPNIAPPSYFNVRENFEADQAMLQEIEDLMGEQTDKKTAKKETEKLMGGMIDPFTAGAAGDPFSVGANDAASFGMGAGIEAENIPEPIEPFNPSAGIQLPDFKDVPWALVASFTTISLGAMYAVKVVYDLGAIRIG